MKDELLNEIRHRAASIGYDQYGLDHAVTPQAVEQLVNDRRDLLAEVERLKDELTTEYSAADTIKNLEAEIEQLKQLLVEREQEHISKTKALQQISRMKICPDHKINLITLTAALALAREGLGEQPYIIGCPMCGKPYLDGKTACQC